MFSLHRLLLVTTTLSVLSACTYDYSRFNAAEGGSSATEAEGGADASSTQKHDSGGNASHTTKTTAGGSNATGGATDTEPPTSGGTTNTDTTTTSTTPPLCVDSQLSDCSGTCVDLKNDNANCGNCGHTCTGSLVCVAGACGCKTASQCGSAGKGTITCVDDYCHCNTLQCKADESCVVTSSKSLVCATISL